jgi:crotonobetainyl-CoA:carnitine CoA-transferase CaiB-like acyl-CoA transferase
VSCGILKPVAHTAPNLFLCEETGFGGQGLTEHQTAGYARAGAAIGGVPSLNIDFSSCLSSALS